MNMSEKTKLGVSVVLGALLAWSVVSFADRSGDDTGSNLEKLQRLERNSIEKRASRWHCTVEKQFACTPDNCSPRQQDLTLLLDFQKAMYQRCFSNTCDKYKMQIKQWGIYSIVSLEREGGSYFMVLNDGSEFTESISQGMWTMTAFGRCSPE